MDALHVGYAAQRTGWSPRMLRDSSRPVSSSRAHARRLPALRPARAEPAAVARRAPAPLRHRDRGHGLRGPAAARAGASAAIEAWLATSEDSAALGRVGATQARAATRRLTEKGLMATTKRYDVKDLALAEEGMRRIEWADRQMPVLAAIRERFEREQPLAGYRVSACLHVTTETANLMRTLQAGGADVVLCASNPLSTQDDVAAALVAEYGVVRLRHQGRGQRHVLLPHRGRGRPQAALTMDDGADVIGVLHSARREQLGDIIAGTEETTTGVIRLKALEARRDARLPDHRGQRGEDEAHVRQPLRHRPVDDRRDHPGHERPARRASASSSPATAGSGAASPRGPAAWARTSSSPRSIRCKALEASMDGFEVLPMERGGARSATSSAPPRATST